MLNSNQWKTKCPICGTEEKLIVISAVLEATGHVIYPNSKLDSDGFEIDPALNPDGKDFSTENERVKCKSCGARFDLSELEIENKNEKPYTVVGFYASNYQPFVDHRNAPDPQEAARLCKLYHKDSSIMIVEIFEGHLQGALGNEEVLDGE